MDANSRNRWFLDPGPCRHGSIIADNLAAQRYTPLTIDGYTASVSGEMKN